jgi:hypothetical protein
MENYVLLYHFEDDGSEQQFENKINNTFWRHQTEDNQEFKYFGFADREEPGVVDKLNTILHPIGLGTKDYVALYHAREEDNDNIKRRMLAGHDSLIETKVEKKGFDAHRNSLTKLLNYDYVKAFPQPPEKSRS